MKRSTVHSGRKEHAERYAYGLSPKKHLYGAILIALLWHSFWLLALRREIPRVRVHVAPNPRISLAAITSATASELPSLRVPATLRSSLYFALPVAGGFSTPVLEQKIVARPPLTARFQIEPVLTADRFLEEDVALPFTAEPRWRDEREKVLTQFPRSRPGRETFSSAILTDAVWVVEATGVGLGDFDLVLSRLQKTLPESCATQTWEWSAKVWKANAPEWQHVMREDPSGCADVCSYFESSVRSLPVLTNFSGAYGRIRVRYIPKPEREK